MWFTFGPGPGNVFAFVAAAGSPAAQSGLLRFPGGTQTDITYRNNGDTLDIAFMRTGGAFGTDGCALGDVSNMPGLFLLSQNNNVHRSNGHFFQSGASAEWCVIDSAGVHGAVPFCGSSADSVPFMLKSTTYAIAASAVTLTAAQYQCCIQVATGTPGADRTVIAPTVAEGTWLFVNQTNNAQTFKTAAGSGISVATLKSAWLRCDGTNIVRLGGDF